MRQYWIEEARRRARALLRRYGVKRPGHILLESWARLLGVQVVVGHLKSATAQLTRNGSKVEILIPATGVELGALRFAIAHELGHFLLGHPSCSPEELLQPTRPPAGPEDRDYEAEANAFAAELLMPAELVMPMIAGREMTLDPVHAVAEAFTVSILASSRRIIQLTRIPSAAVFSTAGQITWFETSPTFCAALNRGRPIAPNSIAAQFFAGMCMLETPHGVPGDAWGTDPSTEIVEHAIAAPKFGTVLSMLQIRRSRTRHSQQRSKSA